MVDNRIKINKACFVKSSADIKDCPDIEDIGEIAFIGRSNVGKSSLINMLTGIKGLAKTSSTPGKTQCINHFSINDGRWYLVDLPGYGYAKASKVNREKWANMTLKYITNRENLAAIFVLVDARIKPQLIDIAFMKWLSNTCVPFAIVFTKMDKPNSTEIQKNVRDYKIIAESFFGLPTPIFFSSVRNTFGKDELLSKINNTLTPNVDSDLLNLSMLNTLMKEERKHGDSRLSAAVAATIKDVGIDDFISMVLKGNSVKNNKNTQSESKVSEKEKVDKAKASKNKRSGEKQTSLKKAKPKSGVAKIKETNKKKDTKLSSRKTVSTPKTNRNKTKEKNITASRRGAGRYIKK